MAEDKARDEILQAARSDMERAAFADAVTRLEKLLSDGPDDGEALYMLAVCQRYQQQFGKALGSLQLLKSVQPEFGRAFQEEGHVHRDQGNRQKALIAYQRATRFNPALEVSWRMQGQLLGQLGSNAEAQQAIAQAERLATMPNALVTVTHLIHEGKTWKAEMLCRKYLQASPKDVEGMRLLADIGSRLGVLEDADFLLESAVEFDPDNIQLRLNYIQILRKRQKFEAALAQARKLIERDADNPLFQSHYAIELMQTGDYEKALQLFDQILEKLPEDPATLTSRGHALKTYGKQQDAIDSYRAACAAKGDHGDAWYALANLKTYRFSDQEIEEMKNREASADLAFMDRVHLCFALGKAFEDEKDYDNSFTYYDKGNALKRAQSRYDADEMTAELEAIADACDEELFTSQKGDGYPASDPIFILGLPRAGSTLLEQILASHSQIDGTMELPNILALAHRLRNRKQERDESNYPKSLHRLNKGQLGKFGEDFIKNTMVHRGGAPFFIDKMPNNFRHIGLIHLILPNARIIDARREPMACCFSGFKQLFAEGQEFTYGLREVGQYYRDYVGLMDHWDRVLPGKVLRVQHEDVLDDLAGQVRRMLDWLKLPFEQACVDYHQTERAVRTASSEQVRQPIFTSSVEQWRNFETHLEPLKTALGPTLAPQKDVMGASQQHG